MCVPSFRYVTRERLEAMLDYEVRRPVNRLWHQVASINHHDWDDLVGWDQHAARLCQRASLPSLQYLQCNLTLRKEKGEDTAFFAFADTVSAGVWPYSFNVRAWFLLTPLRSASTPAWDGTVPTDAMMVCRSWQRRTTVTTSATAGWYATVLPALCSA